MAWVRGARRSRRHALARRRPVGVPARASALPWRQGELGRPRAIAVRDVPPVGRDRIIRRVRLRLVRRDAVLEAVLLRGQDIALLVREHLLDRVGLLDVRDKPVPDPLPGGVGVAAEHELPARGVDLQELRPVGVAAERRVDDHPRSDLVPSIDDLRLAMEDLAQDLLDRLRRIAANRAAHACLRRRPDLFAGKRVHRVDGPDVALVERDRVVEEEIDLLEFLLLDVEHGVGKRRSTGRHGPSGRGRPRSW